MEPTAPRLILVPTDFSAPSARALRYGAALAQRFSAHLLVIYADDFAPPVDFTISAAAVFDVSREQLIDVARGTLRAFAEANIPRDVRFDARVLIGTPVDAILSQAAETGADLIVMGTHGRSGLRRLLVGSVTEAMMRMAPVPLLVVHEAEQEPEIARWVGACVMPARESRAALRYAALLGDEWTRFVLFGAAAVADRPFSADDLKLLDVCTPDEIAGRARGVPLDTLEPHDVLEAASAQHADLLALGLDADRSFADALRGTMAERIVRQSSCPVLTVNRFAAARLAGAKTGEREPVFAA